MATDRMMIPDWSKLDAELVNKISEKLEENCFDIIHVRSVCTSWRSSVGIPAYLARETRAILAPFRKTLSECTLVKVHLCLFRLVHTLPIAAVSNCDFFLGGLVQDKSEDRVELPLNLQSSVKLDVSETERTSINVLDWKVLPLGDHYRVVDRFWHPFGDNGLAVVPVESKKRGGKKEFIVITMCVTGMLVLKSVEQKWNHVPMLPELCLCTNLVTFKGQFYATFQDGNIVVINPHSLLVTPLSPSLVRKIHLVSCGDELYLVEKTAEPFKVSMLDEATGEWVVVTDLGGRVLCINKRLGNFSFSAKEFPHGCGMSSDSILFTDEDNVTYYYKYGTKDGSSGWISTREYRVTILPSSSVLALRVVR